MGFTLRLLAIWSRFRGAVSMGLFGVAGSLTAGSFQHVIQTCRGGNCAGCGSCAVALAAAVASASAGVTAQVSGRRRIILISVIIGVGFVLYGLLYTLMKGMLRL